MKSKNIIFNHTLLEYNKKYRNRRPYLLKISKKEVEEYDKKYPECNKHCLLEGKRWWLIGDTYYEIPKAPRYTWFRNLNGGVQAVTSVLLGGVVAGGITAGVVIPMLKGSSPTPGPVVDTYYTVTFDTNGGSAVSSQKVKKGECATRPGNDPTKTGYNFSNWFYEGDIYDFSTPITSDITLNADWTGITYTVKFYNATTSKEIEGLSETVAYDSAVQVPVNPQSTDPDEVFEGWYTDIACQNAYDFNNPLKGNLNLYAKFEKSSSITVNWYLTSPKTLFKSEKVLSNGKNKVTPLNPLKEPDYQKILAEYTDCELEGWYTSCTYSEEKEEYIYENQYYFDEVISEGSTDTLNLYAKWKVNAQSFAVTGGHNVDNGTALTLKLISADSNNLGKELSTENVEVTYNADLFEKSGVTLTPKATTGSDELTVTKTYKDPSSSNEDVELSATYEVELGSYSKLDTDSLELGEAKAKDDSVSGKVYIPKRYYSEKQNKWIDIYKIAQNGFKGNDKITDVYISTPTIEIGAGAFEGCNELESIEFEENKNTWGFGDEELDPSTQMDKIIEELKKGTSSDKVPTNIGLRFTAIKDGSGTTVAYSVKGYNSENESVPADLLIPSVVTVEDESTGIATSTTKGLPVTEIDENGFAGCSTLKTLTIHSKSHISYISSGAFGQCNNLTGVYFLENQVGASIDSIEDKAFAECSNLKNIEIPNTVEYIGKYAFSSSGLQSIVIPSSVQDKVTKEGIQPGIDAGAFANCGSLNAVTINSNSISSIPEDTFNYCSSLEQFTVPSCIDTIYSSSFVKAGLTSVSFDDNASIWKDENDDVIIEANGNTADAKATNASTLEHGDFKTFVKKVDIYSDFEFEEITKGTPSDGYRLIKYTGSDSEITIPSYYKGYPVVEIAASTDLFRDKLTITKIVIPNTVYSIQAYAFYGMKNLQTIQLPVNEKFTTIPEYCFFNTFNLTSIYIPDSVTKIGAYAFRTDWSKYDGEGLQTATFATAEIKWKLKKGSSSGYYTTKNSTAAKSGQALRSANLNPGYGDYEWTRC